MAKKHKTFAGKIFGSAWDAIKGVFEAVDHNLLEAAIVITQIVKVALNSGIVKIVVEATPTKLDDNLLQVANDNLPKLLAAELLLKSINKDTPTEDIQVIEKQILDSFGGLSDEDKEEFYTAIAANTFKFLNEAKNGKKITFGKAAYYIEQAWQAYKKLKESESKEPSL